MTTSGPVALTSANNAATTRAATASASEAEGDAQSIAGDLQSFLMLLTTQLQNQDPLQPTDSTQFVTQLAMFAQAEQGVNTNRRLETLVDMVRSRTLSDAASFLGKTVTAKGDTIDFNGSGSVAFSYEVPDDAEKVTIRILDANGQLVRSVEGKAAAGPYDDAWDGTTDRGARAPAGTYTIRITADVKTEVGKAGTPTEVPTIISGKVEEMRVVDGEVVAVIAGKEVPVDEITGVVAADGSLVDVVDSAARGGAAELVDAAADLLN